MRDLLSLGKENKLSLFVGDEGFHRHQMPIESRFLENMANALNAEIVGKLRKLRKSLVANG